VGYQLGVDLGTTYTAAAVIRNGRAEVATLGTRSLEIPSVVLLRADGEFLIGEAAERRSQTEPDRFAREFKRRMGDPTPVLLGGSPFSAHALTARLLRGVVKVVVDREGGPPDRIVVTCPANWGEYKRDLLDQAVRQADVGEVGIATEPEAAAVHYASTTRVAPGEVVAVYDLGGGTFDAAILRNTGHGFELLGDPRGIEQLGGVYFDEAVFRWVVDQMPDAFGQLDPDDPGAMASVARLRRDCVEAKESLSWDTDTVIPVALPNQRTEIRLTRGEFEAMIRPTLGDTLDALQRSLDSAGIAPDQLKSVLLVGGSSRIPLVGQLLVSGLGRPVAIDVHPKHAVALGAAHLAASEAGAGSVLGEPAGSVLEPTAVTRTGRTTVTAPTAAAAAAAAAPAAPPAPAAPVPPPVAPAVPAATSGVAPAAARAVVPPAAPAPPAAPGELPSAPATAPRSAPARPGPAPTDAGDGGGAFAPPRRAEAPTAPDRRPTSAPGPGEPPPWGGDGRLPRAGEPGAERERSERVGRPGPERHGGGRRRNPRVLAGAGVAAVLVAGAIAAVALGGGGGDDDGAGDSAGEDSATAPAVAVPAGDEPLATSTIAYTSVDTTFWNVWLVEADGTNARPLTRETEDKARLPVISPDRRSVAFSVETAGGLWELRVIDSQGRGDITVADSLVPDGRAAWSPDGTRLAFVGNQDGPADVYVLDLTTGDVANLTNTPEDEGDPTWSPDGSTLAFWSLASGNQDIHTMPADGGAATPLTDDPADDADPSWSPGGATIAFSSNRSGNWDLFTMAADGSGQTPITSDGADDQDPAWSPDGQAIAFETKRDSVGRPADDWAEIWAVAPDGSDERRITVRDGLDVHPAWGQPPV